MQQNCPRIQLFLLDYNGAEWTDESKINFEQAVANGTGVVFIHASNNAFDGWEAYEKMLGLAWGENSGHGDFHEFKVEFTETEHPITKGLPNFKAWDELYHQMVPMHNVPFQVLALVDWILNKGNRLGRTADAGFGIREVPVPPAIRSCLAG